MEFSSRLGLHISVKIRELFGNALFIRMCMLASER